MKTGRAFGLDDLTMLLGLELADPADEGDIEAIEVIPARRRSAGRAMPAGGRWSRHRTTLRLVPNVSR